MTEPTIHLSSGEKLAETLYEILADSATEAQLKELSDTLTAFKERYLRSYEDVKRQPFARYVIEAMEEALRYTMAKPSECGSDEGMTVFDGCKVKWAKPD
jgi:hypothetical protein